MMHVCIPGTPRKTLPAKGTDNADGTGTLNVIVSTAEEAPLQIQGDIGNDLPDSGAPVKIGAYAVDPDSPPTNVTAADRVNLLADLKGRLLVWLASRLDSTNDSISATPLKKTTYSAAYIALAPAASCTDLVEIVGSASKTVRVKRIRVSGVATAAGSYNVNLIKRSAAATGGTAVTQIELVPNDSSSGAATANVKAYSANPTVGAAVGKVRSQRLTTSTAATSSVDAQPTDFVFGTDTSQEIVLRGAAQTLCLNLNGVTVTGGLLDVEVEWTEE
jgi:hypothetical protein